MANIQMFINIAVWLPYLAKILAFYTDISFLYTFKYRMAQIFDGGKKFFF